jgi:sulfur transfer complex TusBCD TusB component (DsrH family)
MNKQQAAKELKISVRSLQRLVQNGVLNIVYQRGNSGKQEAVFDVEQIVKYKLERDKPTTKLVRLPNNDKTQLARNATLEFLEVFRNSLISQKMVVPIADKVLLTVKDCRLLTGLSEQAIRDAIRDETLKARVIGKGWKIKRGDLNQFIDNL